MPSPHVSELKRTPKVCVCVIMNHPFPANLPLLRQIYRDRFSHVRFLIPFERMEDEDVITVYRGSYTHAGYLTDAHAELAALDCDYYLAIHDDVLLNPALREENFLDTFRLGPHDAFIPRIDTPNEEPGRWIWSFAFVPKLLFPKSILFGAGIEAANLIRYLPAGETMRTRMVAHGVVPTTKVRLDSSHLDDVARVPSRVLLHGLSAQLDGTLEQRSVEEASLEIERRLIDVMALAYTSAASDPAGAGIELPLPVVQSGYFSDLYILPKSGFDDFCHYVGVASAAGLFVEIIAPSLLYATCERVVTAADAELDFGGFDEIRSLDRFVDPRAAALHPFKLSAFRDPERQAGLLGLLRAITQGGLIADRLWRQAGLAPSPNYVVQEGWHPPEHWGRWAGEERVTFKVRYAGAATPRLLLRAPTSLAHRVIGGRVQFNARTSEIGFCATWPDSDLVIALDGLAPGPDGYAEIELVSDIMVKPSELDPASSDERRLGFGIVGVGFTSVGWN